MSVQIGPYTFDRVRYDADGALVGLTLVDVRRLLEQADGGKLTIELPTVADSAELKLAVA
jgi:hypothetical protein